MATRREQIIYYLEQGGRTPKEIAGLMRMGIRDTLDDLEHVRKSVGKRFKIEAASCSRCDFTFRSRGKLSTPSRCPDCRNERISGPWLSIERE